MHVVYAGPGINDTAVIDGFTITAGNADSSGVDGLGGGILIDNGSPQVYRCSFEGNFALFGGGGAHVEGTNASPGFVNCTFTANDGGERAGAMCNRGGDVTIVNSLFHDNEGDSSSGAILFVAIDNVDPATLTLVNCTMTENEATRPDGGTGNGGLGGGIRAYADPINSAGTLTITNCILWGNIDQNINSDDEEAQLSVAQEITVNVSYTTIEGLDLYAGNNNLDDDPLFIDAPNDDFRLTSLSPCVDTAQNSTILTYTDVFDLDADGITTEPTPDLDTEQRIRLGGIDGIVDMGAYEYILTCIEDLTGDGEISVEDLLLLLAAWSTASFPEDINADGTVAVEDLLLLLAARGPRGTGGGEIPKTVQDCIDKFGYEPIALRACIEAVDG